jgi:hypothetical protein
MRMGQMLDFEDRRADDWVNVVVLAPSSDLAGVLIREEFGAIGAIARRSA